MSKRIITALIGLPLLILIVYLNGWVLAGAVLVLSLIALAEYKNAVKSNLNYWFLALLTILVLLIIKFDYYLTAFGIIITFLLIMSYEVFSNKPSFLRALLSLFFIIYVPVLLGLIMLFETETNGKFLIWLCFLVPFATDTFAYFGGKKFGKRKLTKISPNKTITGTVCGLLASIIVCSIYGFILNNYFGLNIEIISFAILGFIASIAAQIGDISASLIKRNYNIKDFGKILPGHGGILDRFDSILFTIPVIFIYSYYFIL